jgi:hypothetical protein
MPSPFGRLHVDGEFRFGWKLERKIGGAGSTQYLENVSRGTMEARMKINAIANEAASLHMIAITVDCGEASCRSGSGNLYSFQIQEVGL